MEFGYWPIRGLGHYCQLALAACELDYTIAHQGANWGTEVKVKLESEHSFVNLPYLIDNGQLLSESDAIVSYAIHKSGKTCLKGEGMDEVKVVQMIGIIKDIFLQMRPCFFDAEGPNKIGAALQTQLPRFQKLENHLKDKDYLVGEHLTIADLYFLHIVQFVQAIQSDYFDQFPRINNHQKVVMALPSIHAFYNSDKCAKSFLPPSAAIKV